MDPQRLALEAERLLPLARSALDRYSFTVKSLDHLATHSNVLYRVTTGDGQQFVLRVGAADASARNHIETEVAWLTALSRDTDLDVVRPIPTGYGTLIVEMLDPDGKARRCVLFSWIPGSPLTAESGTVGFRLLGRLSASLHLHGAEWRPPDPTRMRGWDRVFYHDQTVDPVIIGESRFDHIFTKSVRTVIGRAGARAERTVAHEWSSGDRQVVHGDLHEWNVHLAGSRIYAFDFEDVMMATRAQDISISLYSSRSSPMVRELRGAFQRGYEEVSDWPAIDDERIDSFHAARQIMLMNYAARSLPTAEASSYVGQVMPWLEGYVAQYC